MPRQWKLITLYMVVVFLAFIVSINVAKQQVTEESQTIAEKH